MLGLIKKDLLIVKSNLKTLIIVFIAFIFMSFNSGFEISFVLPFMCIMAFISTFSYDDFNNWNPYAITFPCGKKNIVKSKYIATFLIIILSSIFSFVISYIICKIKNNVEFNNIIISLFSGLFSISLIISIMYPLNFKYGTEKGRLFIFSIVILISLIVSLIHNFINLDNLKDMLYFVDKFGIIIFSILPIIFILISYYISKKIYINKEF